MTSNVNTARASLEEIAAIIEAAPKLERFKFPSVPVAWRWLVERCIGSGVFEIEIVRLPCGRLLDADLRVLKTPGATRATRADLEKARRQIEVLETALGNSPMMVETHRRQVAFATLHDKIGALTDAEYEAYAADRLARFGGMQGKHGSQPRAA